MWDEDEYQPQERDELTEKLRELIDTEVRKELGNKLGDYRWLQKERTRINCELSKANMKIRELENEKSKFLKEHTKTVHRELFGSYTIGDIVYYAKSKECGKVTCETCNNSRKLETKLGERSFTIDCPDCHLSYYDRTIFEYTPERDKVNQINSRLWAGGERMELEVYLDRKDGTTNGVKIFRTEEECRSYCDEMNKKEQTKRIGQH